MQEKNVTAVTFGGELTRAMKERGVKPTALAKAIGVSHVAILNYMKGRIPNGEVLLDISKHLGVSPDSLLRGTKSIEQLRPLAQDEDLNGAPQKLREIKATDPSKFRTVQEVIATFHESVSRRRASSLGEQTGRKLVANDAAQSQEKSNSTQPSDAAVLATKAADSDHDDSRVKHKR